MVFNSLEILQNYLHFICKTQEQIWLISQSEFG